MEQVKKIILAAVVVQTLLLCSCGLAEKAEKKVNAAKNKAESVVSEKVGDVKEKAKKYISKNAEKNSGKSDEVINKSIDDLDDKPLGEIWAKRGFPRDSKSLDEAVNQLIVSAEAGDREKFAAAFTENIRSGSSFETMLDEFFAAYPKGLAGGEFDGGNCASSASYHYGHNVQDGSTYYTVRVGEKWYFVSLEFCFENTDSPDDVGVTRFSIENLEAYALRQQCHSEMDSLLVCNLVSEDEVCARLINDAGFVFEPTPDRVITRAQMEECLKGHPNFSEVVETFGEPNVSIKYSNCTGHDYYYELEPENGEPRYAHIVSSSQLGRCIDAYLCTEKEQLFSGDGGVLLEWEKPPTE